MTGNNRISLRICLFTSLWIMHKEAAVLLHTVCLSPDCIRVAYCRLPNISALLLEQELLPVTLKMVGGLTRVTTVITPTGFQLNFFVSVLEELLFFFFFLLRANERYFLSNGGPEEVVTAYTSVSCC